MSMPLPVIPRDPLWVFLDQERHKIRVAVERQVNVARAQIRRDPTLYVDSDHEVPSIDIRLVVFREDDDYSWSIAYGAVDYDLEHGAHCSSGEMMVMTDSIALTDQLIEECE